MEVNLNCQIYTMAGGRRKALLPSRNPHDLESKFARSLIESGRAEATRMVPADAPAEKEDDRPLSEKSLDEQTVQELRATAKAADLEGYGNKNKAQLIEMIRAAQSPDTQDPVVVENSGATIDQPVVDESKDPSTGSLTGTAANGSIAGGSDD